MKQLEVNFHKKLKKFDLDMKFFMKDGGCLGILGASGCGKSMTLKAIAGIATPERGKISTEKAVLFDSGTKTNLTPQRRKVGYLFQNYALFPNMTVADNIAAGIREKQTDWKAEVARLVRQFQLEGLEKQYPGRLSGGQQQRTALARILASRPDILLLDEPFSAMDSYLKEELQMELKRRIEDFPGCTVLVSHDRDEVYRLCTHTMIMDNGVNLIYDETKRLFDHPRKAMAARLTGCKNISRAVKTGDHQVYAKDWKVSFTVADDIPKHLSHIGIRAHDFVPVSESEPCVNRIFVEPGEKVQSPFEWTLIFHNREDKGKGMWLKVDRGNTKIPSCVQVDPAKVLLLEDSGQEG